MTSRTSRALLGALAIVSVGAVAAPAFAQDGSADTRLRKLEAEVSALQRAVFPGPNGRFFKPEITGPAPTQDAPTRPSTTAVTDILARLDTLETQIQSLTAQTEGTTNALSELETRLAALEVTSGAAGEQGSGSSASQQNLSVMTGGASMPLPSAPAASPPPPAASGGPTPARLAAVQAIAKPQTSDPADDEYSYGFRLWEAGFYPEAQQQLALFVEKYPDHWRATYGRNLLGRAYLDGAKPDQAAPWFLKNYQADKQAARAPDSLLYLAEAMIATKDTDRACIALAEFAETYPAIAAGRLSGQYEANRTKVDCN